MNFALKRVKFVSRKISLKADVKTIDPVESNF